MSDDLLSDTPSEGPATGSTAGSPRWRRFLPRFSWSKDGASGGRPTGRMLWRAGKWLALILAVFAVFYYPIGMLVVHRINDEPTFGDIKAGATVVPQGASQAVATAAGLIDREINQSSWPANDPPFMPGWMLDNMPNFQMGMIGALKRFSIELQDQIGRNRGTSGADADLQAAVGALNYPPDVWVWDPKISFWPTASSEDQYRNGLKALLKYNDRLARGQATFERRADNLLSTLERIGKDLGAASNEIDHSIDNDAGSWIDFHADDVFYYNKGLLYANALLLRDLGKDYGTVLSEKGAGAIWDRMVASMLEGAELGPWIVINGRPDALMQPNHLAGQGFYLLRARAQLEELTDILQK